GGGLGDIRRPDGAEQLAFGSGLRRNDQLEILERGCTLLRGGKVLPGSLLELGAAGLEALDVVRRGPRRLALRQQKVAAEAGLHFHAVADVAKVGDLLKKNDFHLSTPQCWSVYGSRARKRARLIATASWR